MFELKHSTCLGLFRTQDQDSALWEELALLQDGLGGWNRELCS